MPLGRVDRKRTAPTTFRLGAVAALAFALAGPDAAAEEPGLRTLPLELLRDVTNGPIAIGPRGLELDVAGWRQLALPLAAQELELDVEADGPVLLTWAARTGGQVQLYGPPWRYATLPRRGTLRIDLRLAAGWTPSSQPVLLLDGAAHVGIRAIRARAPPGDPRVARATFDRALLLAPESVGHTTINTLTPSFWSASRGVWLADVLAGLALLAGFAVLVLHRVRHGRWRPGLAVGAAALVAICASDAHFLVRFLPMANLSFAPDAEARIREGYYFAPEVGALAALARTTLRPDERIGVMGAERDWFTPQTLCFNLAPRRCAIMRRGAEEHAGIRGIGRLRSDEIDAIVSFRGGPLPEGFAEVAAASPRAIVARRR